MGFSLVGNSGDSTSNTTNYNYTASLNPQLDFEGAAGGNLGINISPLSQGGSTGEIDPQIYDYYAPLDIVSTGDNQGNSALSALQAISKNQAASSTGTQLANSSGGITTSTLSSLTSGNTIYFIIGAIVLFLWAES